MHVWLLLALALGAGDAKEAYTRESRSPTHDPQHAVRFDIGELRVVIGDHAPHGGSERSSYTGIHHLSRTDRPSNVFVPYYAGMIGLRCPVPMKQLDDHSVVIWKGEGDAMVRETYRVAAPCYVDHEASFVAGAPTGGWNSTSYMNAPGDPGIWLIQPDGLWVRHDSIKHGTRASVAPAGFGPLAKPVQVKDSKYPHGGRGFHEGFSDLRFDPKYPLFYGRFDDHVLIFMIERRLGGQLLPYLSPTGGGFSHEFGRPNPAWDYRFALRELPVGKRVKIRSRLAYKRFISHADVLAEYEAWTASLDPRWRSD